MATDKFDIDVAASVIADISAGIYRTPAGAIKELISNAFDADAHHVHITTNWPHFRTFTCTDDGTGMTPEKFRKNMGLIGGSSKRDEGEYSPGFHRPLIGRIGIGILSIAQICRRFEIFSSAKGSDVKFRASIDLEPYMRPEARRVKLGQALENSSKVKIGSCEIEIAPESREKSYTRVVMEEILPGFRKQLLDEPMGEAAVTPKKFAKGEMADFLASVSRNTVSEHGAYAQLIWELAATAPIKYLPGGPVAGANELADLRERLEGYKFKVSLDGVELFKPILLPSKRSVSHKIYPHLDFSRVLPSGRKLRVRGYMYWQKSRILPRELQGVLVRVRNVGIGAFDPTYLGYPKHEGWKFSQLSGELYVDEGLDEAINIDRASFRETDEAYLALQELLFARLGKKTDEGKGIFTSIKAESKDISVRKKKEARRKRVLRSSEAIYGKSRPIKMRVEGGEPGKTPTGVKVTPSEVVIEEELADQVPPKYKDLFIGVCGLIERTLESSLSASKRRELMERLAKLFSAQ